MRAPQAPGMCIGLLYHSFAHEGLLDLALPMGPDSVVLDDPKTADEGLPCQQRHHGRKDLKHPRLILGRRAHDDEPLIVARRIAANVGEAQVEGDETSGFPLNDRGELRIGRAGQLLLVHGLRIMTGGTEGIGDFYRKILINFEAHERSRTLSGKWRQLRDVSYPGSAKTRSLARSAAYARAARIPACVKSYF